jgi:hypothetical protein
MTLESEARGILDRLTSQAFEDCYPITRSFADIPNKPCLYAVKHQVYGLLYIGRTQNTPERFRGGHKAFLWAWLDHYDADDVRLSFYPLTANQSVELSSDLEALILRASEPPYNVRYPVRD